MKNYMNHVVIVGGGAAGLTAAIIAARERASVTVLEAGKRVGSKILKTGNGRCNLTNMLIAPSDYNDPDFVTPVINSLSAERICEFFETLGMMNVEEGEGRVYPLSNSASTVLDVLRFECERLGVEMLCNHEAVALRHSERSVEGIAYSRHFERGAEGAEPGNLAVERSDGLRFEADRVIVATGGGTKLLSSLGHTIAPFQPVLCPLKTDTRPLKGLSGIRVNAEVSALAGSLSGSLVAQERGEVLFRDYGVSGIVIFNMSRLVNAGDWLSFDFLPDMELEEVESWLFGREAALKRPTYAELMCGMLQRRLNNAVIKMGGCRPSDTVNPSMLSALAKVAKNFCVQVEGPGDPKQAQVTRGGAATNEFDPLTLESKLVPGVYAAGEVLNIDGRCGGFNLHWAWASGITAGLVATEE